MKKPYLLLMLAFFAAKAALAQTFTGTNSSDSGHNHTFNVAAATIGISVEVPNTAEEFSHLFLKAGSAASPSAFQWAARLSDGSANAIYLERPELVTGSYGLHVFTPETSAEHSYAATVTANPAGLRSAEKPVSKAPVATVTGTLASGGWQYFRVELPEAFGGWRLSVSGGTGEADLYVGQGFVPTEAAATKFSAGLAVDTVHFSDVEGTAGSYFVGVHLAAAAASGTTYTLTMTQGAFTQLIWDPGTSHAGTVVKASSTIPGNAAGGDFLLKLTAENVTRGAWRTALKVTSGEADLYLSRGGFPTPVAFEFKSERAGSDGVVLDATQFAPGEEWFFRVRASPGAVWSIVSGEVYVENLGTLAASGVNTTWPVGPEGVRFFQTTIPSGTRAWALWLNGANLPITVRKNSVPVPDVAVDLAQNRQMLVVPPYLGTGSDVYFVGIPAAPGTNVVLDSHIQAITPLGFTSDTSSPTPAPITVSGYGYKTYQVTVPPEQIAWEVEVTPNAGSAADFALRRGEVPNEFENTAFSEAGGTLTDSVTISPPTLSDGTYYVTVYGVGSYTFHLKSGNPVAQAIAFTGGADPLPISAANPRPTKVGWQFFRFDNIPAQLGKLGWEFSLTGQVPGTQLALRRNAVPSRWNFRSGGSTGIAEGHYDYWSTSGFLQRPGHQADVYYVGVYQPAQALGNFTLHIDPIPAPVQAFNGASTARTGLAPGRWEYFKVTVPAGAIGWDVRLVNVNSGSPVMTIRRDLLAEFPGTFPLWSPESATTWPTGYQWGAASDWTNWALSPGGVNQDGRILAMGLGHPVEPGTYYVGIYNADPLSSAAYTLQSRGIGSSLAIPVGALAFTGAGSTVSISNLAPREAAYFAVTVPANTPSWQIKLTPTVGEAMFSLSAAVLPTVGSGPQLEKTGNDLYTILPGSGSDYIPAGLYYLAVISEGVGPAASVIGSGNISATLQSKGPLPVGVLGSGTVALNSTIQSSATLEGGDLKAYSFTVPPGLPSLEMRIESTAGAPLMGVIAGPRLPRLDGGYDYYGYTGAEYGGNVTASFVTVANPPAGTYRVLVQARDDSSGTFPTAAFTVKMTGVGPVPIAFDDLAGGSNEKVVTEQEATAWRYFTLTVPAGALGWDFRLTDAAGGAPLLFIRRGTLLPTGNLPIWNPYTEEVWPENYEMGVGGDIIPQSASASGASEYGHHFSMGVGRSLVAGETYTIGVYNSHTTEATSYTLRSRGINPVGVSTYSIPTRTLAFSSTPTAITGLDPRERAYFRVTVPAGQPSWQIKLAPSVGEANLTLFAAQLPNAGTYPNLSKEGNDHFVILPLHGETTIPAGNYFLAVTSQGVGPVDYNLGTGPIDATLQSKGNLPVTPVPGTLAVGTPVQIAGTLEAGEVKAYSFTVPANLASMEVRLENVTGAPLMGVISGTGLPRLDGIYDYYGYTGGQFGGAVDDDLITLANPAPGAARAYRVLVQARAIAADNFPGANFTLRIVALAPTTVAFDDQIGNANETTVTAHAPGTWRYFQIAVPSSPAPLGWDVRLTGVTGGQPQIVIRRGSLPDTLGTTQGWNPGIEIDWPLHNQWGAGGDWTPWQNSPAGESESGRLLAMGVGQPLIAGQTYSIGVYNSHATEAAAYTLRSRGISAVGSTAFSLRTKNIPFAGGSDVATNLAAREAAYFRVTVPAATPSWRVRLTPTAGEAMLTLTQDFLPNVASGPKLSKAGADHYVILPPSGQSSIAAGNYYLAVVSEGVNPGLSGPDRIGNSSADAMLESLGVLPTTTLPAFPFTYPDTLAGGALRHYTFTVPPAVDVFEFSLDERVGNPVFALRPGTDVPRLDGIYDYYGYTGGAYGGEVAANFVSLIRPAAGTYSVAIQARDAVGGFPDAAFTIKTLARTTTPLNFGPSQNGNGSSNAVTQTLGDGQSAFYAVNVPTTLDGLPVLGWRLNIARTQGSTTVRIHHTLATLRTEGIAISGDGGVIVPPYLTPGSTWYVEVLAGGATTFTLTSTPVLLERPLWTMPAAGQPHTTPGLPAGPIFADTGYNSAGAQLLGDGGTDLAQADFDFYAFTVPAGNGGLLRTMLEAINGNPNLYLRAGGVPTETHASEGRYGNPLIDHALVAAATTEYGNWVPLGGTAQVELTPGTWYVAIKAAGNSNSRYRLRLSVGSIQTIAYDGAALVNQSIAGGDWRYYKVTVPQHAPAPWEVSFSQVLGDVVMYVRDTVPPGQAGGVGNFIDWSSDGKNQGPYPVFDPPGTHTFTAPPLRPGHVYYLGFRAVGDATFNVSTHQTGPTTVLTDVAFYGGTATVNIAPGVPRTLRIIVPADATRWRHTSLHSANLGVQIEQGTLPQVGGPQHWTSDGAQDSSLSVALTGWPWVPGQTYYLTVRNNGALTEPFTLNMNGRNVFTEDEDNDGLPDAWEIAYFGSRDAVTGAEDTDRDGLANCVEWALGFDPRFSSVHLLPRPVKENGFLTLTVNKPAGVVGVSYTVKISSTLATGSWTTTGTTVLTDDATTLKVRDNLPITTGPKRFLRVEITKP